MTATHETSDVLALYAAVAASPDDAHLRAVLADALEGAEELVQCPAECVECETGQYRRIVQLFGWAKCPTCGGTGSVSNGAAALAAGYRALAEFGLRPRFVRSPLDRGKDCQWYNAARPPTNFRPSDGVLLPGAWYEKLSLESCDLCPTPHTVSDTRRAAEDAAAMAWAAMTDGERGACRMELSTAIQGVST